MPTPSTNPATGAISRNPATGELIATHAFRTPDEVEHMLDGNAAASRLWRTTPMAERVATYRRLSATLRERSEALAAITVADNAEHAIELANTSDYGLGGNRWTRDIARARRIARRLETGGVFINGFSASNARIPVGGVKKSGYERELSHVGLRAFTNAQAVWAKAVD
ncbi:aldehyde dehydrogenase family protein [Burkholderia cepacia]|uniref:NAD-dependent aldehyde dehydrogenase n=1 Tax=Burkholderia cepacia GG4 TaxID=1009846 RepID=A0A9W3PCR7_BURCE|nr:aldehyde dehydrogenase family protein [Burkholderia cepacia]AFQ51891.1 NAD-dependent aldehyde dehydrogenase [Burkholderia cepacia GG4]